MSLLGANDDLLSGVGHCRLCGRYYDINEVHLGVFTDYFLLRGEVCPCPTCFSHQLHRVQDPNLADVLDARKFCDSSPSAVIRKASVWHGLDSADGSPDGHN